MSSPDPVTSGAVACHVERSEEPGVLRWVVTSPDLGGDGVRVAPSDSPLSALAGVEMWAGGGVLHVRCNADAADVMVLDEAVRSALASGAEWLCVAGDRSPSLAVVQRLVDDATRSLTEFHGGGLEVVGIDGDTVLLRASGTCHGCRFTDETLRRLAAPAVQRRYPGLRFSVLD